MASKITQEVNVIEFELEAQIEQTSQELELLEEREDRVRVATEQEMRSMESPDRVGGDYPSVVSEDEYENIVNEIEATREELESLRVQLDQAREYNQNLPTIPESYEKSVFEVLIDNAVQISTIVLNILTIIGLIAVNKQKKEAAKATSAG